MVCKTENIKPRPKSRRYFRYDEPIAFCCERCYECPCSLNCCWFSRMIHTYAFVIRFGFPFFFYSFYLFKHWELRALSIECVQNICMKNRKHQAIRDDRSNSFSLELNTEHVLWFIIHYHKVLCTQLFLVIKLMPPLINATAKFYANQIYKFSVE